MLRAWYQLGVSAPATLRLSISPSHSYCHPHRRRYAKDCTNPHYVMSDTLAMIENKCKQILPPRIPPQQVTVIGAGSEVGRIVCLMLKQQNIVKILSMYDECEANNVLGAATDLAHIDTSTAVRAYQGRRVLRWALHDTDVVLVCGGTFVMPPCSNIPDIALFYQNLRYIKAMAYACTKFCPKAIIAIQTPPVDANFGVFKYVLKQFHVYNKRKLLGVNAVNCMRANQLYARYGGSQPEDSVVPVVGGTTRCTRIPVLHGSKMYHCLNDDNKEFILTVVRECDDLVSRVKGNYEQGHLSIGFATARYITGVMRGLIEMPTLVDSTLIEQAHPSFCYNMKYCSTPITIGKKGVSMIHVPMLGPVEQELIERYKCDVDDMINLGRCNSCNEDAYALHPDKCTKYEFKPHIYEDCTECKECKTTEG